uniref:Putative secreted protein n=1 Tax=Anopheles marajoara TaxID=58244 RepID=A0A2M4CAD8_9DIPT
MLMLLVVVVLVVCASVCVRVCRWSPPEGPYSPVSTTFGVIFEKDYPSWHTSVCAVVGEECAFIDPVCPCVLVYVIETVNVCVCVCVCL